MNSLKQAETRHTHNNKEFTAKTYHSFGRSFFLKYILKIICKITDIGWLFICVLPYERADHPAKLVSLK